MIDLPLFSYKPQQSYPHKAGHRGVQTSVEAAKKINRVVKSLDSRILEAIKESGAKGFTSGELADKLGIKYKSAQPSTSRLKARGLIRQSGLERQTDHCDGPEGVWVAV